MCAKSNNQQQNLPKLSAIVLCRNERHHIEACVRSILKQELSVGCIEVIVVDGMSQDGTRDCLRAVSEEDSRIRIVDNPAQTTPCAINVGIKASQGEYIAILGAHTEYAANYLQACVDLLEEHPEVCCAGGPILSQGKGVFGKAVAIAMSHPVGIGNAKHRHPRYEGYAEGACYPMFRRTVFDRIGLYDEAFIRNQDDEFNFRLGLAGEKVFISPRARCTYFVRETPAQLFKQYFEYGFWRVVVLRKHHVPASFRQIVPAGFMLTLVSALLLSPALPGWWRLSAIALPMAYGFMLLGVSAQVVYRHGWKVGVLFPVAAMLMHSAYAVGFGWALLRGQSHMKVNTSYAQEECHDPKT